MLNLQRVSVVITAKLFCRATYSTNVLRSSTKMAAAATTATANVIKQSTTKSISTDDIETSKEEVHSKKPKSTSLVAAAFESLKSEKSTPRPVLSTTAVEVTAKDIDECITNAKTVNNLLMLTEGNNVFTRKHALRVVSVLSDWTSINRVKLTEFENDARFLRICRMLGRTPSKAENKTNDNTKYGQVSKFRTDDLNTVLSVTGDDEAAKLIASISLPQMVKVMSTLANKKRRSTPLLRSLAFNISSSTEVLDLKSIADVFYAMSTLNFQDSVLAAKLCTDMRATLPNNGNKSAAIGSVLTSLGLLKYRDLDILEALTQWILQHSNICRQQDLCALFHTSAVLNFRSTQLTDIHSKLGNILDQQDFVRSCDWLTHVWSLVLMGISNNKHLESVLNTAFIEKLQSESLTAAIQMKVLNLNSYAQLIATNYKGPLLTTSSKIFDVPLTYSKTKQILVNGMLDALKSFLPSMNHLKTSYDSQMGFLIDACCLFDDKRNALLLNTNNITPGIKVALMVVDYHDVCHGPHKAVNGITALSFDLLEKNGYHVLPVFYNEFSTSDKLLKRVQYLENKLKIIIDNSHNDNKTKQ